MGNFWHCVQIIPNHKTEKMTVDKVSAKKFKLSFYWLWLPYVTGKAIIFLPLLLLSSFFFSSPNLSGRKLDVYHTCIHGVALVWIWNADLKCAARSSLEIQDTKSRHFCTIAQLCRAIPSELRHVSTIGKNFLNSNTSSTCPDNMVNFGLLTAEICWWVWGTVANFNSFCILAVLLHGTLVLGVSQTLRRWTNGATYIQQGGHQVWHWPTFLVDNNFKCTQFDKIWWLYSVGVVGNIAIDLCANNFLSQ